MFRLVLFTVTVVLTALANAQSDNPFSPEENTAFCYDIHLKHDGVYILTYSTEDNTPDCGGQFDGALNVGDRTSLQLAPGATLTLSAVAGRSVEVVADQSGTIRCSGASLIGFECGWRKG